MSLERLLIVPDTHSPFEDRRAWKLMLRAARAFGPHIVVHQGDLADFYTVSSHSKDPSRAQSLKEELKQVKKLRKEGILYVVACEQIWRLAGYVIANYSGRLVAHRSKNNSRRHRKK